MFNFWQRRSTDEYNWFDYLNVQMYRTLLGLFLVWVFAVIGYVTVGDLPHRGVIFMACLIVSAIVEFIRRGWRGWHTIEDLIFFTLYGIGGTMVTFTGYQATSASAVFDMQIALPMLVGFFTHLFLGAMYRLKKQSRQCRGQ